MEVDFAFVADAAVATPDNKISVLGAGFEDLRLSAYPGALATLALVVKLRFHPAECDREHAVEIELWDPNGGRIGPPMHVKVTPKRHANDAARSVSFPLVLTYQQLVFPAPGTYDFHIVIGGTHLRQVSIHAHPPTVPPGSLATGPTP